MMIRKLRRQLSTNVFVLFGGVAIIWIYCEFLIYYVVVLQCSYPTLQGNEEALRVLLISDPHLLGTRRGHWLDKWRRERQMSVAFQAIIHIHKPETVFFLGDLFDEGLWNRDSQFQDDVQRFRKMFSVPADVQVFHVAGNHDMGFHNDITQRKAKRFEHEMEAPTVRLVTLMDNHFVLINSMALEGDSCNLCKEARRKIQEISDVLACWQGGSSCKGITNDTHKYSRPILMQHFPLYRASDAACSGDDAAPLLERGVPFRNKIDAISKEATQFLKESLKPRAAFGGHTHHGCKLLHGDGGGLAFPEYSTASFSWRNRPDPRYYLVQISAQEVEVNSCGLPKEITIATTAVVSLILLIYIVKFHLSIKNFYCIKRVNDLNKVH